MNTSKKDDEKSLFESLIIFLKLNQFKFLEEIILEKKIQIDAWDHKLLKSIGTSKNQSHKEALLWILERGDYKTKHPQIALCVLCQCDQPKEVKELIEQGCDTKEPPWEGGKNAMEFAIHGDSASCLEILVKNFPANELDKLLLNCASQEANQCSITILKEFKKPNPITNDIWEIWSKHPEFPQMQTLAQTLTAKTTTPTLQKLLKSRTSKTNNTPHINIISKELQMRKFKEAIKEPVRNINLE